MLSCTNGKGSDGAPSDGNPGPEQSGYSVSCTCMCGVYPIEREVCVPVDANWETYCEDTVCPFVDLLLRDSSGKDCEDVACGVADENMAGQTTTNGATHYAENDSCLDGCSDLRCDCTLVYSLSPLSADLECEDEACTSSSTECQGAEQVSEVVCSPSVPNSRGDQNSDSASGPTAPPGGADTGECPPEATTPAYRMAAAAGLQRLAVRVATPSTRCVSGRGVFALVPVTRVDSNRDGTQTAIMKPLQVSGTGRMTDAAWITSASLLRGTAVNAIRVGTSYTIDGSDRLRQPRSVSVRVSSTPRKFAEGLVAGSAPFVGQALGGLPAGGDFIDVGWACPTLMGAASEADLSGTYTFRMSDVGCPVDWPQEVTIAIPLARQDERRGSLSVEFAGRPSERVTATLGVEDHFAFSRMGVSVKGRLAGHDDQFATIDLDSVSYGDLPLCVPGRYRLAATRK